MPVFKSETKEGLLTVRQGLDGDRICIALAGELDLSNAETAEKALLEALASDKDLLVDLGELEFADSTGVALLIIALREKGSGISFLPCQSAGVRRLLDLTGLDKRMRFETTEVPALAGGPAAEEAPAALPAA